MIKSIKHEHFIHISKNTFVKQLSNSCIKGWMTPVFTASQLLNSVSKYTKIKRRLGGFCTVDLI